MPTKHRSHVRIRFTSHTRSITQPHELGEISEWQAEWKWDGIRAQVIKRKGEVFIWSRGEDLITDRFPEITDAAFTLPDGTVLDGEILPWIDDRVLPFTELQRRIGRKNLSAKILSEVPVILQCTICWRSMATIFADSISEHAARCSSNWSLHCRSVSQRVFRTTEVVEAADWNDLASRREAESRTRGRRFHVETS